MTPALLRILIVYAILAISTIYAMYRGNKTYYIWLKTVTSFLFVRVDLAAAAALTTVPSILIAMGLVFCLLGDIFLALANEIENDLINKYFRPGVISFLIAHLCFCIAIYIFMGAEFKVLLFGAVAGAATVGVTTMNGKSDKYDFQGNLQICTIYSFFVGAFLGTSLYVLVALLQLGGGGLGAGSGLLAGGVLLLPIGGVLFLLSDLILSVKLFMKQKFAPLPALVLLFYYSATMCLAVFLGVGAL